MKTKFGIALGAAIVSFFLLSLPASAENTVTERERRDCQADYHKYCSEYGLGTEALRACMSRNIKKISNACVAAFVDAGEMSQAQADKLRGKAKTTTKKKPTSKSKTSTKKKPTSKKVTSKSTKKK